MKRFLYCLLLLAGLTLPGLPAQAQLVADGGTKIIDATTTNIVGNLTIGTNGSFTTLLIRNAGVVTSSGTAAIGFAATARTNQVIVDGAGSAWTNTSTLNVGTAGTFNLLMITNGGRVEANFANISINSGSGNNAAVVTGPGSVWVLNGLNVGSIGPSNSFMILNGGKLINTSIGRLGNVNTSTRNLAVVAGAGSLWTNFTEIDIGGVSHLNELWVTNGGKIFSDGAYIGGISTQAGSGNSNRVVLSGSGSTWTNTHPSAAGNFGSFNQLTISNGAVMQNTGFLFGSMTLGFQSSGGNNTMVVTGTNSLFSNRGTTGQLTVGQGGKANQLSVRNGAMVETDFGSVGDNSAATNNLAVVADGGSVWTNRFSLYVGNAGSFNQLTVTNGGTVRNPDGYVGNQATSIGNLALVADANSLWTNQRSLYVGNLGSSNQLFVSNGGTVIATNLFVGFDLASSNNTVTVNGGRLLVTNGPGGTANWTLEVRRGGLTLNAGLVAADRLWLTNGSASQFTFNGGRLQTRSTIVSSGSLFTLGIGGPVLELVGTGTHQFSDGLNIPEGAILTGNGAITGNATSAGLISPGAGVGKITIFGNLTLNASGTNFFELNKTSGTNDSIAGASQIIYGGALVVTNLAGTLALGDTFILFSAANYAGSFSSIKLPTLDAGLAWTNKLLVNGSLQVISNVPRDFGVDVSHFQNESGIPQANWNQMYAEGRRFAFIKATEGLTGPHDAAMATNVARAAAAGLLVGVYHYAHPENRPTTNGAVLEASNMVVYAGSAIGPGRLRPVLDLEGSAANLTASALTDWVIAFGNEMVARRGPSAAPIIYTTQFFVNSRLDSRLANYDLWLRTTGSGAAPATDDPPGQGFADATGVFNNWSFWQYSDSGISGGITPLDQNVCHNDFKPLASFLITAPTPTPIQLAGVATSFDGAFRFSFTNAPGASFSVLASTNVMLPLSNWTVLNGVIEVSPGQFQFSDSTATNNVRRFYRVRSP